ncbi:MAG: hypothetical protein KA165_18960 [Saprospiraceae bacterium]|nr:hypothetical protein [Saprospiraceae bacterium]
MMKPAERIIPFSKKEKRRIERLLWKQLAMYGAFLAGMLVLGASLIMMEQDRSYKLLATVFLVFISVLVVLNPFRKRLRTIARLWRDLLTGKKRVVSGQVEKAVFKDNSSVDLPQQIYDIGPYRFELERLSPSLKRFRSVMPGQAVEVHQCLHSGFILKIEVLSNN